MNFTDFDFDQLLGMGEETNPLLILVWILPIILFVLYGQRIQLYVTSSEIKKSIKKLDGFRLESRDELLKHIRTNLKPTGDPESKVALFLEYVTIMPIDMDPAGIVPKIKRVIRMREDYTREKVRTLAPKMEESEIARTQTLLEIASSLQMIYRMVNHMFLTAKKQNNYPLILPLQMMLPFIMEHAESMRDAITTLKKCQPIGDGIGPMVVGRMMLGLPRETIALHTVLARDTIESRNILMLKAQGPFPTVGRPADALQNLMDSGETIHAIVMVDAALKMEGEETASIAHGFGAAIGGIGVERYEIEEVAADRNIPIFSIMIKESVREAITIMTKDISDKASEMRSHVLDAISENSVEGQTVLVIGVGNTVGVN